MTRPVPSKPDRQPHPSTAGRASRLARSVVQTTAPQYIRLTTPAEFWAYVEAVVQAGREKREFIEERQKVRAELLGEVATLKKMWLANNSLANPKWKWEAIEPDGMVIRGIAWAEDVLAVTGDANSDPWAYGHEVKGIDLGDSPDNLNRQFLVVMDGHFNYRIDPLPEALKVSV